MAITFIDEPDPVRNLRHVLGAQNLLWSSDYPHPVSTWPKSLTRDRRDVRGRARRSSATSWSKATPPASGTCSGCAGSASYHRLMRKTVARPVGAVAQRSRRCCSSRSQRCSRSVTQSARPTRRRAPSRRPSARGWSTTCTRSQPFPRARPTGRQPNHGARRATIDWLPSCWPAPCWSSCWRRVAPSIASYRRRSALGAHRAASPRPTCVRLTRHAAARRCPRPTRAAGRARITQWGNIMNRTDQIAWLLFLVALGSATAFLLLVSSMAFLE